MHQNCRVRHSTTLLCALALVLVGSAGCSGSGATHERAATPSYAGAVVVQVGHIRFDDGDTFYVDRTPIRVLGIDTPEVANPNVGIFEDQPFGPAAAESTRAMLLGAGVIEIAANI
jgi:endonuclease YncB( thermonuclease family)